MAHSPPVCLNRASSTCREKPEDVGEKLLLGAAAASCSQPLPSRSVRGPEPRCTRSRPSASWGNGGACQRKRARKEEGGCRREGGAYFRAGAGASPPPSVFFRRVCGPRRRYRCFSKTGIQFRIVWTHEFNLVRFTVWSSPRGELCFVVKAALSPGRVGGARCSSKPSLRARQRLL